MINKSKPVPSELRYDLVSHDWVVIATGRAKRPETFKKEKRVRHEISREKCPFCHIETQQAPTLIFSKGKNILSGKSIPEDWTVVSFPNKYPAFANGFSSRERKEGPHILMDAYGFHEIIATRDHKKQMAQFSVSQLKEVLDVYQQRYWAIMNDPDVNYISIFHNHGVEAGASVVHPHSQIIAIPIIDPHVNRSLMGSQHYLDTHNECIYCMLNEWDIKNGKRIVFENEEFLAVCPFASKGAFEVSIVPKKHLSYWERISEGQKYYLAEALQIVLKKIYKGLADPAYNFYLHTAPCDGTNYDYYHWHWVVIPKTSTWAGFEMGAGIEISTVAPEEAAGYLRRQ